MERPDEMVKEGVRVADLLGRLPTFTEYGRYRRELGMKYSEWQIYREFGGNKGSWTAFQYLLMEKIVAA